MIPEYVTKWKAASVSSESYDKDKAEEAVAELYESVGLKPAPVVWCPSPISMRLAKHILWKIKHADDNACNPVSFISTLNHSLPVEVVQNIEECVTTSLSILEEKDAGRYIDSWSPGKRISFLSQIKERISSNLSPNVLNTLNQKLYNHLFIEISSPVNAIMARQMEILSRPVIQYTEEPLNQYDVHILAFFDYCNRVLEVKLASEHTTRLIKLLLSAGAFIPHENICWISERSLICHVKDGRVHCDGGPAIQYPDGFSVWALNGVIVPREIAETPADCIDPGLILEVSNAEARRELARKIGIERLERKLGSITIDMWNGYELIELNIGSEWSRPRLLKMKNPSIGTYHLEGVPPWIDSCRAALEWRCGGLEWKPTQLT